jgi:hypothetical protein
MNPHDASLLIAKLGEYFKNIAPAEHQLVQTILEKYPLHVAEKVVSLYAQETATFDRGKLHTLLREENSRQAPFVSPTARWKDAKNAETEAIAEFLSKIPEGRLHKLIDNVRKKSPDVFALLKSDPMQTDIGRALIYNELKNHQGKSGLLVRSA